MLADISGFTALADALAGSLGAQRGAEELSRHLNLVYGALIAEVDRYGGSVLGFSGDAITCWFDAGGSSIAAAALRAATAALAMQRAVRPFAQIDAPSSGPVRIAVKLAVAAGPARRLRVGDGAVQCLDALAGATIDRVAQTERHAEPGEVVIAHDTALLLGDAIAVRAWRPVPGAQDAAVLLDVPRPAAPAPWPTLADGALTAETLRPWLLPAVHARLLAGQGDFLAELRPAVAVFVHFGGVDYDADDAAGAKLDRYVRWVQEVLARYEGTLVDLTFGDTGSYVYAAFGAPTAHENDAERALRAALDLLTPPAELAFVRDVHIGISRGRTRAGPVGGPTRRAYAVTGSEVNVAARLMQAARANEILVSEHVMDGTRGNFTVRAVAPVAIKGRGEPVRALVLEGLRESSPPGSGLARPSIPMVGREAELAAAVARLDLATRGAGQLVAVTAEAGMGKSRLLAEIVREARARRFRVHAGEAQSFGTIATYLAWRGVWRGLFGLDAGASPEEQLRALEESLARIDPALVPRLPLLAPVVGLTIADNELTRQFEAKLRKDSLEALLATCLRAKAAESPLLLALEDVHWMDALSLDLLESLGRAIAGMRVVLVATLRASEATLSVAALPHYAEVPLHELTHAESAELIPRSVRARLGPDVAIPDRFVEMLHARAEGNPFLALELASYLFDRGVTPEQALAMDPIELPSSLSSAILSRIDRLNATQQTTLKIASVLGRSFRFAWLWGAHPELGAPEQVRGDLEALARLELTSHEPDASYAFKHAVIQEVAYESLPFATRAKLHEQLAGWLEGDAAGASLDLLAFHYGRSTNRGKQAEYFQKAGDAAAARYANDAAAQYYERLLEVVPAEEQPAVLLSLGAARERVSRWDDAERHYKRALELVGRDGAREFRARVCLAIGGISTHRAGYDDALRWLAEARGDFASVGDRAGQATVLIETANTYRLQGRLDGARAVLEETLALEGADGNTGRIARAYHVLGNVTADEPDIAGARDWWTKSLELRRTIGEKPGIALMILNNAVAAFLERKHEEAGLLLAEAQRLCTELGMRLESCRASQLLALTLAAQGNTSAARTLLMSNLIVLRDLGALREMAELMVSMLVTWRVGEGAQGSAYALRIGGAGEKLFETLGSPISPPLQARIDRDLSDIRAHLGAHATETAWADGRAMEWPDAVAYAMTGGARSEGC